MLPIPGIAHWTEASSRLLMSIFVMVACLLTVLIIVVGFERIGGYIPCALCLQQREPYYVGLAVLVTGAGLGFIAGAPCVWRGTLALVGLLMVYSLVTAFFHAGVEWSWWAGPAACGSGGATATDAANLLGDLDAVRPPSCDEAALRVLGLSFAGWNVVISAILAFAAFRFAGQRD